MNEAELKARALSALEAFQQADQYLDLGTAGHDTRPPRGGDSGSGREQTCRGSAAGSRPTGRGNR
jgi:hypothetical protein